MNLQERFSVKGKRVLVTGGSKGIGAAIALVLAEAGANVAIVGRDSDDLATTAEAVRATGRDCLEIVADLTTADGPAEAAGAALVHFGAIDVLVNNAGISRPALILDATTAEWDETMAVNLRAPFLLAQAIVPKMIEQGYGKIINVSSQASVAALDEHASYSASKGGLNMLTKVMAIEWGKHNIQCNAVAPTVILTPMGEEVWGDPAKGDPMKAKIPLGRFGMPVDVADLVLFLASPASDMMTGEVVMLDGGYTAQ